MKLDLEQLRELIRLLEESNLTEIEGRLFDQGGPLLIHDFGLWVGKQGVLSRYPLSKSRFLLFKFQWYL